jgi:demethylmenaquinone methyltransferase/2-methoxy-6-polyprenyl-1,4-benzoquinol methylase
MSSLALMRWLEGSPERYDAGMRLLTFGRVPAVHAAVARAAVPDSGGRVLEIGCGTGAVTARLHARGASVTAIDQSPAMLEQAKARLLSATGEGAGVAAPVEWLEQTASEIDSLQREAYDAVVICLCLSDMSQSERAFVLRESVLRLVRGGRLVVADEVYAPPGWRRILQRLWRIPQAALGWLLVGSLSRPIPDLSGEIREAGLPISRRQAWMLGSLELYEAERPR